MNNSILVLGDSGTGKSTSIRTLPHESTFIINVLGKALPFKGSNKYYTKISPDGLTGNYYTSDSAVNIKRIIKLINDKRPEILYLIIDDLNFVIMNAYMGKCLEKGYEKYSVLGKEFSEIISSARNLRDNLFVFMMMHVETDQNGKTKPRTVGRMVDQYVCIEGNFTICLHTIVNDGHYKFVTNNDNYHMCKSPMGMFDQYIDNDLKLVVDKINEYINEEAK